MVKYLKNYIYYGLTSINANGYAFVEFVDMIAGPNLKVWQGEGCVFFRKK